MSKKANELYEFGPFRVDPREQQLTRDGQSLSLPPKAFETLLVLVRNSGHLLSKDDLMKAVWPDRFVEEVNLSQNISILRKALGDTAQASRYIVTIPGRGYRFVGEVSELTPEIETEDELVLESHVRSRLVVQDTSHRRLRPIAVGALALTVLLSAGLYWRWHRTPRLTTADTVVLADFVNTTGDPVFDGTLKQALEVALRQSPFLNMVSESSVNSTLKQMTKPSGSAVTKEVAREVCLRDGNSAYIVGSIASVGSTYVIGLQASNCQSGDTIAATQATVSSKDKVMGALGETASAVRRDLGESLASVQKFNVPLPQATTASLDALKAYSESLRLRDLGDDQAARVLLLRAVELDPNFALAYAALGLNYANLGEVNHAVENIKNAFALRDHATERERLYIEASYYGSVTGEADRAIEIFRVWAQSYPQDPVPYSRMASRYATIGNFPEATKEMSTALKMEPDNAGDNGLLIKFYLAENQMEDARRIEQQVEARHLGGYVVREAKYYLAFLNDDEAVMRSQLIGDSYSSDYHLFGVQANTEAYFGRYASSRDYCQRGVDASKRNNAKETGAAWQALAALREAEAGNRDLARKDAQAALDLAPDPPVQSRAAIALARTGDTARAQALADALDKQHPLDTMIQSYYLPSIRAAVWIEKRRPQNAIDTLKNAETYELGGAPALFPTYLRGVAYLQAGRAKEAASELQKLVDHRGVILNYVPASIVYVHLGRAQGAAGNRDEARKSYQHFLDLWKNADPDLPILKQAKAEYAKLQ